jgi:hypothetical protein
MKYNGSAWKLIETAGLSAGIADYTSLYACNGTTYAAYTDVGK